MKGFLCEDAFIRHALLPGAAKERLNAMKGNVCIAILSETNVTTLTSFTISAKGGKLNFN